MIRATLALVIGLLAVQPALAQNRAGVERQFQSWLQRTVWPAARAEGVSRATFDRAFDGVTLNWDLPDLVPPGSRPTTPKTQVQTEFGAPALYFSPGTVTAATRTGRQMASRHAAALARAERTTGVPGRIVLGIWGRESGYGQAPIRHDVFQVLGTKGFMSTRAPYFTKELIAALRIAETGPLPPRAMKSSWAGALGQPQFMPTNVLAYARDGDGDGRADIWGSPADTIASIATYLQQHGWQPGRDWGFEVRVPPAVSCTLEGPDQGRPLGRWQEMGIARVSGRPFPAIEAGRQLFLLMPAGRHGPAFLVTPNFYVLKDYNMSDLYALFVGHVGDRIQYGSGDFATPWARTDSLFRSDIAAMQRALERQGHDVGGADGLPGFRTRRSIGRWQEATGRPATCFPEASMKRSLAR
ncbi:lytic murein transglycosylase [Pseudodonghicola flavimaris]|uniref:Lytic murein transglycosylase n=1 Tax=Pseudodonghicola flavimaris TaxID=3050036 RepID=A0ABT7F6F8_9RHOB|nr:lytic murein transglycosylase [Pseudodonghicola flavimaris]MDK3020192.1 lytic murein transglycosylase [Pseudodonghicola flavimaris]